MLDKLELGCGSSGIQWSTPDWLIHEIAESKGFVCDLTRLKEPLYWAGTVCAISSAPKLSRPSLSEMVALINPDPKLNWSIPTLKQAYKRLKRLAKMPPQKLLDQLGHIGHPTPSQPAGLTPACFVYRALTQLGVTICKDTTVGQLSELAKLVGLPNQEQQAWLAQSLAEAKFSIKEWGASLLLLGDSRAAPQPCCQDLLAETHAHIEQSIVEYLQPRTHNQAIVLAALHFSLDISKAAEPLTEFYRRQHGLDTFADPHCRQIQQLNPKAYNLEVYFNPSFSLELHQHTLEYLGKLYGIRGEDHEIYEQLQERALVANFYPGVVHGLVNFSSSLSREDLTTPDQPVFCFGSDSLGYVAHLASELSWGFETTMDYSNPEGGAFDLTSIASLKSLLGGMTRRRNREVAELSGLKEAIKKVETYMSNFDRRLQRLRQWYQDLKPDQKEVTADYLKLILETGLYMRGWAGRPEPYPIELVPYKNKEITCILASEALARLDEFTELEAEQTCKTIHDLPLIIYKDGRWLISERLEEGLTIAGRLIIVKVGERGNNMNSCIRDTSNWLVSSAARYMTTLGIEPGFDVTKLRFIQ